MNIFTDVLTSSRYIPIRPGAYQIIVVMIAVPASLLPLSVPPVVPVPGCLLGGGTLPADARSPLQGWVQLPARQTVVAKSLFKLRPLSALISGLRSVPLRRVFLLRDRKCDLFRDPVWLPVILSRVSWRVRPQGVSVSGFVLLPRPVVLSFHLTGS